jgi:hypothetical protein
MADLGLRLRERKAGWYLECHRLPRLDDVPVVRYIREVQGDVHRAPAHAVLGGLA